MLNFYKSEKFMLLVCNKPLSSYYWMNVASEKLLFCGIIEYTNFVPQLVMEKFILAMLLSIGIKRIHFGKKVMMK